MPRLVLLLTYLVVSCEASPAAMRLYNGLDQNEPVPDVDSLGVSVIYRQSGHRRSRQIVFSGVTPAAPATVLNTRASRADAANPFPADTSSTGLASKCEVGADLKYTYEGSTWKLLSRGPCAEGQWAVMVAECQPGCRPLPCPAGQLEHQGRCVNLTDPTVCGEGQVLYIDQTGSTFCDCAKEYLYYPRHNKCYTRQERGPCDFGFYLDRNEEGSVECMPNNCQADGYDKDPVTGKCFRRNYVENCPEYRLQFHRNNQTVVCIESTVRTALNPGITPGCPLNAGLDRVRGRCLPFFTNEPSSPNSGCPPGFKRVGDGPCRRSINT